MTSSPRWYRLGSTLSAALGAVTGARVRRDSRARSSRCEPRCQSAPASTCERARLDLDATRVHATARRLRRRTICVLRNRAMVLPVDSLVTVTSHTWVLRPMWVGIARPTTRSPSRALPRKLHLSSMVVKLSFGRRGRGTRRCPRPRVCRQVRRPPARTGSRCRRSTRLGDVDVRDDLVREHASSTTPSSPGTRAPKNSLRSATRSLSSSTRVSGCRVPVAAAAARRTARSGGSAGCRPPARGCACTSRSRGSPRTSA